MQETQYHAREKSTLQPQPKLCRALHGASLLSNTLSTFHLRYRTCDLLGNCIETLNKLTNTNGLTK